MKKNIVLGIIGWLLTTLASYKAAAQETPPPPPPPPPAYGDISRKETQEIIIRKNGDKNTKLTLEISGDKILINGKPLIEFSEDGLTINNRKMITRDGDKIIMDLNRGKMDLENGLRELDGLNRFDMNFEDNNFSFGDNKEYTFLGVTTEKNADGVKITEITKDSPAEKAGLQKDDIIWKIDETKIDETKVLSETIRAKKAGDKVKIFFKRNGKMKDEKVTLGAQKSMIQKRIFSFNMPDGKKKTLTVPRPPMPPGFNDDDRSYFNSESVFNKKQKLGIKIQDTEDAVGVKVLDVDANSPAATAGILKEDIITSVSGNKVLTTDEAREALQNVSDKTNYTIKAKRNGNEMNFNIKIPKKLKIVNL
jgi:serine protease Do